MTKKITKTKDAANFNDNFIINYRTMTDFYKYTMGQMYFHQRPNEWVKWEFKCRSNVKLGYLAPKVNKELDHLCTLKHQQFELDWLAKVPWFTRDYIEFLEDHSLKRKYIDCHAEGKDLVIVAEGPQKDVFWFEIYVLQIVQQLYMADEKIDWEQAQKNLDSEIIKINKALRSGLKFTISDFGIRRSLGIDWEEYMCKRMFDMCPAFVGTSNVYLAIKLGCKAIGTFAHELYGTYQGLRDVPVAMAQTKVLEDWANEYRGALGIALSDNFGFKAFLNDFDLKFAKLFDGCRHDSGDPIRWGEMLIAHYKKLGIDPTTKTAVWSDSLDIEKALKIAQHFNGRINVSFGIGTFLCATICGTKKKPLSMVMKVIEVNNKPVTKLSDAAGKQMCHDNDYIEYVKNVYDYKSIDEMTVEEIKEILPTFNNYTLETIPEFV